VSHRAQLALAQGRAVEALALADRAYARAKSVKGVDPVSERYAQAKRLLLIGDCARAARNPGRARQAWEAGLALARSPREQPGEAAIRAELLERNGQRAQANSLRSVLAERGIRNALLI
jgi:hypothetical protein